MIAQDGRLEAHRASGGVTIAVDIYADLVCPYSFILKFILEGLQQRYEKAHPGVTVELLWRPHCVIPPLERRIDKLQMYRHFQRIYPNLLVRIQECGAQYGLRFVLTGFTGSSRAAHRLIRLTLLAAGPARQAQVVETLYRGHFLDGMDISDEAWLLHVGLAAGLPRKLVRSVLRDRAVLDDDDELNEEEEEDDDDDEEEEEEKDEETDEDEEDEDEEDEDEEEDDEEEEYEEEKDATVDAFERDVPNSIKGEAVPCVIIQGRYKVGGLQNAEVYEGVFDKVRAASGL